MPSHIDWLRDYCLSLPHATEDVQWENNLLFRIAGKMFCIASLEPSARVKFCFKCTPEKFAELVEIQGVIPAPYMARNHWVGIVEVNALRQPEMKELIQSSYQMVFEKLPKKLQAQLNKKKSSAERVVRKRTR
ncbi:MAG TPA: MmcQ/YjbR family DNA-binding protein [Candidatus Angelobacter sp.]|jgi:predicted DNA-binding protein (MmcQ/YjbR family)|nr:MmcQ/YjbR family DNA-binding protein [Candidatus Angelobacter sp.]